MHKIDGTRIALILTNEQISEIDRLAKRHGTTRSQMTRNMIDVGMTVTKDLEKVGIFRISEMVKGLKEMTQAHRQPKLF